MNKLYNSNTLVSLLQIFMRQTLVMLEIIHLKYKFLKLRMNLNAIWSHVNNFNNQSVSLGLNQFLLLQI